MSFAQICYAFATLTLKSQEQAKVRAWLAILPIRKGGVDGLPGRIVTVTGVIIASARSSLRLLPSAIAPCFAHSINCRLVH